MDKKGDGIKDYRTRSTQDRKDQKRGKKKKRGME
jgi:hypothetical protein